LQHGSALSGCMIADRIDKIRWRRQNFAAELLAAASTARAVWGEHREPHPTPFSSSPYLYSALVVPQPSHNGGRSHEVPRPQPVVGASPGAPPQPRHIAVQARVDSDNMAQGEGSAAAGGEAGHTGQEEHRGVAAAGAPDLLCRTPAFNHLPTLAY
jgi:hypothetical protein